MEFVRKKLTLVLLHQGGRVLLGMKKRGFGAGKWNGFGGKVEGVETVVQAAQRELQEEAGITALDLTLCGTLKFSFDPQLDNRIMDVRDLLGGWRLCCCCCCCSCMHVCVCVCVCVCRCLSSGRLSLRGQWQRRRRCCHSGFPRRKYLWTRCGQVRSRSVFPLLWVTGQCHIFA